MLERIGQLAEHTATNVSRRRFFGWLGRGALATATVVAGALALSSDVASAATVCGGASTPSCRGKPLGAGCNIGGQVGVCSAAPACTCKITGGRPGRR